MSDAAKAETTAVTLEDEYEELKRRIDAFHLRATREAQPKSMLRVAANHLRDAAQILRLYIERSASTKPG